jgi:hypothetical protein
VRTLVELPRFGSGLQCLALCGARVGGDHDVLIDWFPLCPDDLALGVVLDSIYIDLPVPGDDFTVWLAEELRATPAPCAKAPCR